MCLYGLSSVLYVGFYTKKPQWMCPAARWIFFLAFLAHAVDIGWRGVEHVHPGTSIREALGFLSWLMVGGYLLASIKHRLGVLGVFVAPAALGLLAVARLSPTGTATEGLSRLGRIHISVTTLGVALFAVATGFAAVYLLGERGLKSKRFDGILFKRGMALQTLDRITHRMVLVGFPIFTIGILLGMVWSSQRSGGSIRPEYPLSLVGWGFFASLLVGRSVRGWRGRKTALLTILGFTSLALVLVIYLLRRAMG
jgi:ABC-type uncharacterized transport system permease subunit